MPTDEEIEKRLAEKQLLDGAASRRKAAPVQLAVQRDGPASGGSARRLGSAPRVRGAGGLA